METLLVVGIDSVVGANVAATLSGHCRVVGLSSSADVPLAGVESHVSRRDDAETIRGWLASVQPDAVVHCGPAAQPSWVLSGLRIADPSMAAAARNWAEGAAARGCRLAVVSSDAVFTGPWMFHEEDCPSLCASPQARAIQALEREVLRACPGALLVRTHAYGWTPRAAGTGWLEKTLAWLESGESGPATWGGHATPILASTLAERLAAALERGLSGTYHIAGAERVSSAEFVRRLADQFGLPQPSCAASVPMYERPSDCGAGETSLQSRRIRRALGLPMPMVAEGLEQLHAQRNDGAWERLNPSAVSVHDKVA